MRLGGDVRFTAASSHTLDCVTSRFLTFDLTALTDGFQPDGGYRLDASATSPTAVRNRPSADLRLSELLPPNPAFAYKDRRSAMWRTFHQGGHLQLAISGHTNRQIGRRDKAVYGHSDSAQSNPFDAIKSTRLFAPTER